MSSELHKLKHGLFSQIEKRILEERRQISEAMHAAYEMGLRDGLRRSVAPASPTDFDPPLDDSPLTYEDIFTSPRIFQSASDAYAFVMSRRTVHRRDVYVRIATNNACTFTSLPEMATLWRYYPDMDSTHVDAMRDLETKYSGKMKPLYVAQEECLKGVWT